MTIIIFLIKIEKYEKKNKLIYNCYYFVAFY
jgi:hypothetical protein